MPPVLFWFQFFILVLTTLKCILEFVTPKEKKNKFYMFWFNGIMQIEDSTFSQGKQQWQLNICFKIASTKLFILIYYIINYGLQADRSLLRYYKLRDSYVASSNLNSLSTKFKLQTWKNSLSHNSPLSS